MRARSYLLVVLTLAVIAVFSMALSVSAQDNTSLIIQAIQDMGTTCANLLPNQSCLAHVSVQSTTNGRVIDAAYTAAGDRASIYETHAIQTSPINSATGDFGVNVMRVQAGSPANTNGLDIHRFRRHDHDERR